MAANLEFSKVLGTRFQKIPNGSQFEIFKDSVLVQDSGKYPMTANLEFQQKSLGKHKTDHSYINVHYKRIF